jgi:hypothetical protein
MSKKDNKLIVVILKVTNDTTNVNFYLMSEDGNGMVQAFESEDSACKYFSDGYEKAMKRGGSWPASAVMNYLNFTPSVVVFDSIEELSKIVNIPFYCYALHSVAGICHGIPCNESGEGLWNSGVKPKMEFEK